MALEQLLAALERDAARTAEQRIAGAEAEAAHLRSAARVRADALVVDVLRTREAELRGELERTLFEERRRLRRETLQRRQRLLDQVRAAVEARLPATARDPANRSGLARDLEQAFVYVEGLPAIVLAPPDLVPWARSHLQSRSEVKIEADPSLDSGLVVTASDGSVRIDITLGTRLNQTWQVLCMKLLQWMEHPEAPCAGTT